MHSHEVVARNIATESENRIHSDEVARTYGFEGGLVPGVTVYAYTCAPVVQALGEEWIETGSAKLRLLAPCYEGERVKVVVGAEPTAETVPDAVSVEVTAGGRVCARGTASAGGGPGARERIPHAVRPPDRPVASAEVFQAGRVLGGIRLPTDAETMEQYLESIDEPNPVYLEKRRVHPGMFLNGANWVLAANVVMPAWIHAESEIRHLRSVSMGERVEVRARIAEAFDRRHRFAVVDVDWVCEEEVVATGRHTVIWQLAAAPKNGG